jgi:hypothetical protein
VASEVSANAFGAILIFVNRPILSVNDVRQLSEEAVVIQTRGAP